MKKLERINTIVQYFLLMLNAYGWRFWHNRGNVDQVGLCAFLTGLLLATLIWKWVTLTKEC